MSDPPAQPSSERVSGRHLLKSTTAVCAMTLLSRVMGLVRDMVFARLFGAGFLMDAFFVAFKIPNIFRRWSAEGAFSQAFVAAKVRGTTRRRVTRRVLPGLAPRMVGSPPTLLT